MQILLRPALLLAGLWLAFAAPAQTTFFPDELIVSASALNLRERPDKSGKVVEKLPRGAVLRFLGMENDGEYVEVDSFFGIWLKVQFKNKTGYVFSRHVVGAYNIFPDGDYSMETLPPLQWYGVYPRDSFADELRPIEVRLEKTYHELFDTEVNALRTNQPETAKFIIGTIYPLRTGFAGSLGIYEPVDIYLNAELAPGAMLPIYPGQEMDDTTAVTTWFLAAIGCAHLDESDYVRITEYHLFTMEMQYDGRALKQDMSPWFQVQEGMNPSVGLVWFGDLDGDHKPDAVLQDTPEEMGLRISLFLSSKAKPGMFLQKVCEHQISVD